MNMGQRGRFFSLVLICSLLLPLSTHAEQQRNIYDESIYELLVDRYFNGSGANDYDVNTQQATSFAGGDFVGLVEQQAYIQELGFTTVAIGSVFDTNTYDGTALTSYDGIEPHFGTEDELHAVIQSFQDAQVRVMIDFRLNNVSADHEWLQQNATWATTQQHTAVWDYTNKEFTDTLVTALVQFQQTYKAGAIRLTEIDDVPQPFLEELIAQLRDVTPNVQIVAASETTASVDAYVNVDAVTQWADMFKATSQSTASLSQLVQPNTPQIAAVDLLTTPRITYKAAEENAFPPTRIKIAMATLLTLPVVPQMTYGTEISMNGADAASSHQIQNFKVDKEIIEYIADIQSVRNKSAALRTGDFELLHEDNGFVVFSRSNDDETWLVAINNTAETQSYSLSTDMLGDDMELKGLFEKDIVRVDENGQYNVVVNRELVELYQVKKAQGFNYTYMGVMAFVYIIFIVFIWLLIKRAKRPTRI